MRNIALVVGLSLLASTSAGLAKRSSEAPEAKPTGEAVSCLQLSHIRESRVRSDSVIDFKTAGGKWYRNTLPHSCPALGFEERFSYRTSIPQLCSVDTIRVLSISAGHVQEGASCGLGKFQPIELAAAH